MLDSFPVSPILYLLLKEETGTGYAQVFPQIMELDSSVNSRAIQRNNDDVMCYYEAQLTRKRQFPMPSASTDTVKAAMGMEEGRLLHLFVAC